MFTLVRLLLLLLAVLVPVQAQTTGYLSIIAGDINFGSAVHTRPMIIVANVGALPATCTVGEVAFVSNATAGAAIYECSASNTWTQQFSAILATTCTNQVLTAIATTGGGTCTTLVLASAYFANQGTTTTLLHGNAAGNLSWTQIVNADITNTTIDLTTKVTGVLPTANIAVALANQTSLRGNSMAAAAGDATIAQTIAHGAKALATGAISSATCTAAQTDTATGTATTDVINVTFNGDPTAVTGYVPLTTGMLTIIVYPTVNTFNAKVCNNTAGSITPGAITLNWTVVR